ncbi:TraB/GumN family protein [Sphingomonas sp. BGYR3]|uniref:TraB/GumN family protein n=1 Tax=Sphingomonas sp. BGYR3 TaxID=2975483 RepID=UPI0021A274A2|nr:TraB/GumN family protein [Sphingomonas sp. BGYR3]MDG5487068.1 TraB/GumN family protein [Sphingomonas sp. BGYR3]
MLRTLLNTGVALTLAYCPPAIAQQAAPAAPAAATQDADPALWVVKDEDTTIYLFGTVHALKPGLSWFDEAVKSAFDKSDELVLEIVMPGPEDAQKLQQIVMEKGVNMTGPSLTEKLPAEKRAAYAEMLKELGLPAEALDRLDPWFASMSIMQIMMPKIGFSPENGAEATLTAAAKSASKPISGVETVEQQFGFFDGMSEKAQMDMLVGLIDERNKTQEVLEQMLALWKAGKPDELAALIEQFDAESPEMHKVIFADRNARWADWIKGRMAKPGTVFMAVGAGHLAGDDSVQAMLKPMKIEATRIAY